MEPTTYVSEHVTSIQAFIYFLLMVLVDGNLYFRFRLILYRIQWKQLVPLPPQQVRSLRTNDFLHVKQF